jgi:hypothetical protein
MADTRRRRLQRCIVILSLTLKCQAFSSISYLQFNYKVYPPSSCKRRHKSYQPSTSHVRHRFCQKVRGNACENYSNDGWLSFQDVESIVKTLASAVAIFGALIPGLANAFSLQVANQEEQRVEVFASPIHNSISIRSECTINQINATQTTY